MKVKWIPILGILSVAVMGLPSYAHARGGFEDMGGTLLISLVIIIVVFLILREVVCWYWKINETLSVLKEIRDSLKDQSTISTTNQRDKSQVQNQSEIQRPEQTKYIKKVCPKCNHPYSLADYDPTAEHIYCSDCKEELPKS